MTKYGDFLYDVNRLNDKIKVENRNFDEIYQRSQNGESIRVSRFYQLAGDIIEKYNSYCHRYAYLDFNDLIIKSLEILKKKTSVLSAIQKTFQHILVDEFQDVNNTANRFHQCRAQRKHQVILCG